MAIEPSICRAPAQEPVRWWVAQTRPQDEQRVVDAVNEAGGYAISPRERVRKTYGEGKGTTKEWTRPIFPQYVLYSGEYESIYEARGIIQVLKTGRRDWEEIANFVRAYESGPMQRAQNFPLSIGLKVKIVAGPYRFCEGEVLTFGDTRVFLKVATLGWSEINTDRSNIEPLLGD